MGVLNAEILHRHQLNALEHLVVIRRSDGRIFAGRMQYIEGNPIRMSDLIEKFKEP